MITDPILVSITEFKEEYDRLLVDLQRQRTIFSRKGLIMSEDLSVFAQKYFFLSNGQRFVNYDFEPDISTAEGRILLQYPRQVVIRSEVKAEVKDNSLVSKVSRPFDSVLDCKVQSIGIASREVVYDCALEVTGERTVTSLRVGGDVYVLDTFTNGVLDIMRSPDKIEDKPFSCRRAFLKKLNVKVVPETREILGSILIKDEDGYKMGSTGGYYKFSPDDSLCVRRVVIANECLMYVRGCMTTNNEFTLIKKRDVVEVNSDQFSQINLLTEQITGSSNFIHDIFDYYTIKYTLPRDVSDVKLRMAVNQEFPVVEFECKIEGKVQEIGFRKQLYSLLRHVRANLVIKNVRDYVMICGEVVENDLSAIQYKVDAFSFVRKAKITWNVKKVKKKKIYAWSVLIEA